MTDSITRLNAGLGLSRSDRQMTCLPHIQIAQAIQAVSVEVIRRWLAKPEEMGDGIKT